MSLVLLLRSPASVSKSGSDTGTATENQSTAALTTFRNFPSTNGGTVANDTTGYTLGVEFYVTDADVRFLGFWWWCATGASTNAVNARVYTVDNTTSGTAVPGSDATSGTLTANAWNYIELAKPIVLTANQRYRACIQGGGTANWYSAIASGFAADSVHGPLTVPSTTNATGAKQGSFVVAATMTYPNGVSGGSNYGIDVQVGEVVSSTPISSSDSGSAAEGAVVIGLTGSETSAGTESQSIAATLSSADTATATETAIIRVSSSDSASATDNQSLAVSLSNSDSGTATEANSIAATLSSSDSSAGTDNQTITASFSNSDTSSATENQATSINITSSDSATATEDQRIALASSDTVSATDNNALVVNLSNSDQGTATELAPKIAITSTDTSTATDASAISSQLSSTDNITGVDGQSIQAAISSADSSTATDFGSVPGVPTGSDAVTAQESQSIQVTLSSSDTVTGTEGQRIGVASQDTSSGTENARMGLTGIDTATATEGNSTAAQVLSSDSATATDTGSLVQNGSATDSDSASATETARIGVRSSDTVSATEGQVVYVFSSDGVTATDSQRLAATISDADSVVLQDMWIVDAILASTDALHATESEQASVALGLTGEFGEPFTDSALSMANVATHVLLNQDSWLAELRTYTEDV